MNWELSDAQAKFRKGRGTRDQIANICWIIEKAREFQGNFYLCFTDYTKTFDCVDHNKLWKILKKKGVPDHLTCLLRNLYVSQEATVRTLYGTADWFKIGKGKYCRQEVKGMTEDKMVEWYHRLNGHEFEQTPGHGTVQESLVCCSPWGHKTSDMTEWLNCLLYTSFISDEYTTSTIYLLFQWVFFLQCILVTN